MMPLSYSLTLQDYIHNYHPANIPASLGNSLTSYTSQYIKSAQVRNDQWVVMFTSC